MYAHIKKREGYGTDIRTSSDEHHLCAWKYNGCHGKDYRAFNCVIDKELNVCELVIENIKHEVLRKEFFHVQPLHFWPYENPQFITCEDANRIDRGMAFAFKPFLLILGLVIREHSIWATVRTKY